jgi:5-methyltetrahydrofolate--homocysteine methyltransferase
MAELYDRLNEVLIADGGMGTQLFALGLEGDCQEAWNVEQPDAVEGIHRRYVEAGAQVILTNTFGANRWKLAKSGHEADLERFCRAGAENALAAARNQDVFVLADIGPSGELPEPYGTHRVAEFEDLFAEQIACLMAAGCHGVLVETMISSAEATAAVRAAKRVGSFPVIASMTYSAGSRGYRTMMGEAVGDVVPLLLEAGADAVGANCGLGVGQMLEVVAEIRRATPGPVWAKPNAGSPQLVDGRTVYDESAEVWAPQMPRIVAAGANLVGGCCGTTPEHIAQAAEAIRAAQPPASSEDDHA